MSPEMLKKLGLDEGSSPEAMAEAFAKYMGAAEEKMAKLEAEKAEEEKAKMAKLADDEEKAKMEADKKDDEDEKGKEAKMATMEAALSATRAQLEKLQKREDEREAAAKAERERRFEQLADQAVAGGYPKDKREKLISFARTDYEGARAAVEHLLPKSGAPAHLFDRMTHQGGPIGGDTDPRSLAGPPKPRRVVTMGRTFIEDDAAYAEEIKRVAESEDPATKAKVDKLIPESRRTQKFERLLAAERVVRAERPDLAESAEQ